MFVWMAVTARTGADKARPALEKTRLRLVGILELHLGILELEVHLGFLDLQARPALNLLTSMTILLWSPW